MDILFSLAPSVNILRSEYPWLYKASVDLGSAVPVLVSK